MDVGMAETLGVSAMMVDGWAVLVEEMVVVEVTAVSMVVVAGVVD